MDVSVEGSTLAGGQFTAGLFGLCLCTEQEHLTKISLPVCESAWIYSVGEGLSEERRQRQAETDAMASDKLFSALGGQIVILDACLGRNRRGDLSVHETGICTVTQFLLQGQLDKEAPSDACCYVPLLSDSSASEKTFSTLSPAIQTCIPKVFFKVKLVHISSQELRTLFIAG